MVHHRGGRQVVIAPAAAQNQTLYLREFIISESVAYTVDIEMHLTPYI